MPTETTLADEQISKVSEIVYDKLATVTQWATDAKLAAQSAIDSIGLLDIPNIEIQFPSAPNLKDPVLPELTSVPDYVISNNAQSVTFTPTAQIKLVEPAEVPLPVYGTPVDIPERPDSAAQLPPIDYPTLANAEAPIAPALSLPVMPTIKLPEAPALLSIKMAAVPDLNIAEFKGTMPQPNVPTGTSWPLVQLIEASVERCLSHLSESNIYREALKGSLSQSYDGMNELFFSTAKITRPDKALIAPDALVRMNKMPDAKRKYYSAMAASDMALMKKRAELTSAWAGRNFSIPPGMLIGDVNDLELEAANNLMEKAVEINAERTKLMLEEYFKIWEMFAELEGNFVALYMEQLRQTVETERTRVRSQIELFNAALSLYNSKMEGTRAHIDAYNAELEAQLNYSGAYGVAVEGAVAAMSESTAKVGIYSAQVRAGKIQADMKSTEVQALTAPLEVYKAQLMGVKANADTAVANIETYREAVRAYAAAVESVSAEVEAYAAQVTAAGSGAGVMETNAKAYAAYAEAAARNNTVFKTYVTEQGEVLSANLQTFRDAGNTNESFLRAQAARIAGQAEVTGARVSAFDNYARSFSSYNRSLSDKTSAAMNHSMTSAENAARAQALLNQATAESDKIKAGALAGKASALSGLAQGAMSALHVSASAQGSGSTGSSYGYSRNWTSTWGGTTRKSESKVQRLSA